MGVTVDMKDEGNGSRFNAKSFRECFMAAIEAASRWSSLDLISPPPHGEYKDLQILQPLMHLESLKLAHGFDESFEPLIASIGRNATPNLTVMTLADPAAVLCLAQPACSHIYYSLTTLKILLFKRMDSPVDVLPHLHRLETLEACRLCLSFYPPDSPLPLTHTLRFLYLKSVSIQWMAGHIFPALEKCHIIFPHHTDTIDASQPVTMPFCSFLLYDSNDLRPLSQFHLPSLDTLDVKNAQWSIWKGNRQLISLCPIVADTPQTLTVLRLDIKCGDRLLSYLLELAPALEELWLGLAHPNALSKTFFKAFIARELHPDGVSEMVGPLSQTIAPVCPSLKLLHLHYKRWMRGPDKRALVIALGNIVGSRQLEAESSFSLRLSFDEVPTESPWTVGKPVRKIRDLEGGELILGYSTLHSIIPMPRLLPKRGLVSLPFKKPESLHLLASNSTTFEFLLTRDHMQLMVNGYHKPPPPPPLPCALPLFDALRVLVMKGGNPSFLGGHTFPRLERCRLLKEGRLKLGPSKRILTEVGMPVCTRADIDDLWVLTALKLPRIHELALDFSDPKYPVIWEKHIAVNGNLSGLNLLHMKNYWNTRDRDLIAILRSLPLLETLIVTTWLGVDLFKAFLPMEANGTIVQKQASGEGQTLAVLCPRLRHLQMESSDYYMTKTPHWAASAAEIVNLRAECGSPLKMFTYIELAPKPGKKFELVGRDGSATTEKSALVEGYKGFKLDI